MIKKTWFKIATAILLILLLTSVIIGWRYYRIIFMPYAGPAKNIFLYIPTGAGFDDVLNLATENNIVKDTSAFRWVAEKKHYASQVKPGRYLIKAGMSNNAIINLLRSGRQKPVKVIFNALFTKQELASVLSKQIEADSISINGLLNDPDFLQHYETDPENVFMLLIPNTYEFYWNTSAKQFFERMVKEYRKFWNNTRRQKADEIGLSIKEVVTMASIIELETSKNSEKPVIAGVYMNRIRKGMLLQADPTLKFAAGDYTLKRLLKEDKEIDSPYNTYLYPGLPPGPICLPSVTSVDAVLNYMANDYLYFCADADNPGYHLFTGNYQQHLLNARRYQRFLNKQRIYR